MATLVLSAAGAAIGGAVGGSVFGIGAAAIGQAVGASIGGAIDQRILGQGSAAVQTGRVDSFRLQSSAEGTPLQTVYGTMRVAGHLIWSSQFKEHVSTQRHGGGKGGGPKVTTQNYSYTVSIALALGEGEVSKIGRIWADGSEIAPTDLDLTLYRGDKTQLPDPLIASLEGLDNTPSFRGTAYVVIAELELSQFGNRIPQFNFEVFRKPQPTEGEQVDAADLVSGVCLIPGTGEYSLATTQVHYEGDLGKSRNANVNTLRGQSDFLCAMEDLQTDLPNAKSVNLVVSWFGDDLRCPFCTLQPKVEQTVLDGAPMPWVVGGVPRSEAEIVSRVQDRPVYGGTPSDAAVIEAIQHLRSIGQSVVFYPFILMDIQADNTLPNPYDPNSVQPVMPWRGRITLSHAPGLPDSPDGSMSAQDEVDTFFGSAEVTDFTFGDGTVTFAGNEWSYRRFILHYAHLCALAGGVDMFCIGSELRGLTHIRSGQDVFPFVTALRALAADVKSILGPDCRVTYAADWSEYFGYHPQDGTGDVLFHLDPLWASDNIDCIAIDNYMPLSDWRDGADHLDQHFGSAYNPHYLRANILGGEGYDWYYATQLDRDAQIRTPITDGAYGEDWVFRYKDLPSWWSNPHFNRIGGQKAQNPTDWVPQSKPIVFTEYGCPAVNKGANQPNVFYDPKSSESALPYFSNGLQDVEIQAAYIEAVSQFWNAAENNPVSDNYQGQMIDMSAAHVWAWDARPWPDFPARTNIWSDGDNYALGHWVNGRFTRAELSKVVAEICEQSGFIDYDVTALTGRVPGAVTDALRTGRENLQPLMMAYDFSCFEQDGKLKFRMNTDLVKHDLRTEDFVSGSSGDGTFEKTRISDAGQPGRLKLAFWDVNSDYQTAEVESLVLGQDPNHVGRTELPIALSADKALQLVENWAYRAKAASDSLNFARPPSRLAVTTGDWVEVSGRVSGTVRVDQIEEMGVRSLMTSRVEQPANAPVIAYTKPIAPKVPEATSPVFLNFLDLPNLGLDGSDFVTQVAARADPWPGRLAVYDSIQDDDYSFLTFIDQPAQFGRLSQPLHQAEPGRWALQELVLHTDDPFDSVDEKTVLNGANALALSHPSVEDVEIVQFQFADILPTGEVLLSRLLRGQAGTEGAVPPVWPEGTLATRLDTRLTNLDLPLNVKGRAHHFRIGPATKSFGDPSFQHHVITFDGVALRPWSPAHLRFHKAQNGDLEVNWVRRARKGGDGWDGFDVPLNEDQESYLVEVLQDAVVRRSSFVSTPLWSYTSEEQAFDGVSGSIQITVQQVSNIYGFGAKSGVEIYV